MTGPKSDRKPGQSIFVWAKFNAPVKTAGSPTLTFRIGNEKEYRDVQSEWGQAYNSPRSGILQADTAGRTVGHRRHQLPDPPHHARRRRNGHLAGREERHPDPRRDGGQRRLPGVAGHMSPAKQYLPTVNLWKSGSRHPDPPPREPPRCDALQQHRDGFGLD